MNIITEARELYRRCVKSDFGRSHIWRDGSDNISVLRGIIDRCDTVDAIVEELSATDMYAIRIHDEFTFKLMMEWNRRYFYNSEPASGVSPQTPNQFKMLAYCLHINREMGLDGSTVMELGGGNGQLMVMMKRFGIKTHIDIDIPESLYMAYVCTRSKFPTARVLWVLSSDDINSIDGYDFIFCPVGLEDVFTRADIFVNTASMGEMNNDAIRYWMNYVQNQTDIKYFYSVNRFLNTVYPTDNVHAVFSELRKSENEASILFDDKWEVLNWEVEPAWARCPYEDPKIARYLELILRRSDGQRLPVDYLSEVKMEDWWRYREVHRIGTHRDNQLVNDMTMGGTLFKLWNAMRIQPDAETAEMIMEYLKTLRPSDYKFEEEYFYKKFISSGVLV